jgi:hypothetical protein
MIITRSVKYNLNLQICAYLLSFNIGIK